MPFDGLHVLSLESRRSEEMATLIRKQGGVPISAPSMREAALETQDEAFEFGRRLLEGEFDGVILLTGVGTRLLWKTLLTRHDEAELKAALKGTTVIVRGPKPSAVVRELGLTPDVLVPEPNTWRELLETMKGRPEVGIALQEYGKSNTDLIAGLRAQGRTVSPVRIYGWELPEDLGPLRAAAATLAAGSVDVVMLTTSMQLVNLLRIADEDGIGEPVRAALRKVFIASIGPTTTETVEECGLRVEFEPSHPKMGLLVNEAAALESLRAKLGYAR